MLRDPNIRVALGKVGARMRLIEARRLGEVTDTIRGAFGDPSKTFNDLLQDLKRYYDGEFASARRAHHREPRRREHRALRVDAEQGVTGKLWLTASEAPREPRRRRADLRDAHPHRRGVHRQRGAALPGDPDAPARERINCYCVQVAAFLDDDERSAHAHPSVPQRSTTSKPRRHAMPRNNGLDILTRAVPSGAASTPSSAPSPPTPAPARWTATAPSSPRRSAGRSRSTCQPGRGREPQHLRRRVHAAGRRARHRAGVDRRAPGHDPVRPGRHRRAAGGPCTATASCAGIHRLPRAGRVASRARTAAAIRGVRRGREVMRSRWSPSRATDRPWRPRRSRRHHPRRRVHAARASASSASRVVEWCAPEGACRDALAEPRRHGRARTRQRDGTRRRPRNPPR